MFGLLINQLSTNRVVDVIALTQCFVVSIEKYLFLTLHICNTHLDTFITINVIMLVGGYYFVWMLCVCDVVDFV